MDAARPTPASGHTAGRIRRGARRALTVGVLVPAVALAVAAPAFAAVTAVQGSAYGVNVDLSGAGRTSTSARPPSRRSRGPAAPTRTTVATVRARRHRRRRCGHHQHAPGRIGAGGTVTSSAEVANANIGRTGLSLLTASVINSRCTSNEAGSAGSSTVTGLQVLGQPVTVTGEPEPDADGDRAARRLGDRAHQRADHHRQAPSSSITVNALRLEVNLLGGVATGSVTIAQSVCGVTGDARRRAHRGHRRRAAHRPGRGRLRRLPVQPPPAPRLRPVLIRTPPAGPDRNHRSGPAVRASVDLLSMDEARPVTTGHADPRAGPAGGRRRRPPDVHRGAGRHALRRARSPGGRHVRQHRARRSRPRWPGSARTWSRWTSSRSPGRPPGCSSSG